MARVVLRSALAISAVGVVAAASAFDGGTGPRQGAAPERPAAAQSAAWGVAENGPAAARPASSSYTLKTENGPRAALAARLVTATLLLTGLVLTALGAVGMRGPALPRFARRGARRSAPACTPAYVPRPGGHPRFGPPPT
ncbi:hypothetical protein [Yinghuangia seranimata]|uniref:hypothetical protein n=1 Tax=Yinghuangia seranimata TaxID=408067 RepID=UPI00248D06F5|nr:hypothetical protein [Yinghuangia seranimata]MDI2128012.1 hypothetical protein [Yinghuangia seranimata]